MNKLFSLVIIMTCWAGSVQAQDGRNRYGDTLKFVYIRGHEEGPDLEGEFGVYEDYFRFRGRLGGVFIPVKFRMEAMPAEAVDAARVLRCNT